MNIAMVRMNRVGGPEDLKGMTARLASHACSLITGQTLSAGDGLTAM